MGVNELWVNRRRVLLHFLIKPYSQPDLFRAVADYRALFPSIASVARTLELLHDQGCVSFFSVPYDASSAVKMKVWSLTPSGEALRAKYSLDLSDIAVLKAG